MAFGEKVYNWNIFTYIFFPSYLIVYTYNKNNDNWSIDLIVFYQ